MLAPVQERSRRPGADETFSLQFDMKNGGEGHTFEVGFLEPARDVGLASSAFEAGLALEAGFAAAAAAAEGGLDAFDAGFAFDSGFALDSGFAFDSGLAFEVGLVCAARVQVEASGLGRNATRTYLLRGRFLYSIAVGLVFSLSLLPSGGLGLFLCTFVRGFVLGVLFHSRFRGRFLNWFGSWDVLDAGRTARSGSSSISVRGSGSSFTRHFLRGGMELRGSESC